MIDIYKPETFLYFAYGSNLLTVSIKMHSPSADFVSIGRFDVSFITVFTLLYHKNYFKLY